MTEQLSPKRFDDLTSRPSDKLWGLNSIAAFLSVSVDKARRISKLEHCPIYRPDGATYFASRAELDAWLRTRR